MSVGIPTMYAGVRFRSRLEARWAVFFDFIKWPWQYEPIDLEFYIPDFVLHFPHAPLLVEVKPAFSLDEMRLAARKIDATSWSNEAMVVGIVAYEGLSVLFGERIQTPDGLSRDWVDGRFFKCMQCAGFSVLSAPGSWMCRRCGYGGQGNDHVIDWDPTQVWLDAGNTVQWKATG